MTVSTMRKDEQHLLESRRKLLLAGVGAFSVGSASFARAQTAAVSPEPAAPKVELVYTATVEIAPMLLLGDSALGERRMVPITGGTFEGPGLRGKVLAGGADRQLIRKDGARLLDALYEMQTDDGAILTVHNKVLIHDVSPEKRYAFSTIEIAAPEGKYGWLNRLVYVGTLQGLMPQRAAVVIRTYKLN